MISKYPLIPKEAFLYFPPPSELTILVGKSQQRVIFDGGVRFSKEEQMKLQNLVAEIELDHKNKYLVDFPLSVLLRFLQATSFDNKKCISALQDYKQWEAKMIPLRLTDRVENLLTNGLLYMTGRDQKFRPILVINVGVIVSAKLKNQELYELLGYFFQYVIQNCLIQGQVENWSCIIDLGDVGFFSLSTTLADCIIFLSSNFRCRVHHNYLVNSPSSIKLIWGMIKKVLNKDQIRKISLLDCQKLPHQAFTEINTNQVESKYGGVLPNLEKFWPITANNNSNISSTNPVVLISQREYNQRYQANLLKQRRVNAQFIDKFHIREGNQHQLKDPGLELKERRPPLIPNILKPFSYSLEVFRDK